MEIDDGQMAVLRAVALSDDEGQPVAYSRLRGLTGLEPDTITSAVDHLRSNAFIMYVSAPIDSTALTTPSEEGGYVLLSAGHVLLTIPDSEGAKGG